VVTLGDRRQLFRIETVGQCRRAHEVAEQHAHLAAFRLGTAARGGRRRQEADDEIVDARTLNAGDRAQQTLAIAERRDAEIDQVGIGQLGHDVEVDRVRGEGRGVLAQSQLVEPRFELCRHAALSVGPQAGNSISHAMGAIYRVLAGFSIPGTSVLLPTVASGQAAAIRALRLCAAP
jgi:hypothetical protein